MHGRLIADYDAFTSSLVQVRDEKIASHLRIAESMDAILGQRIMNAFQPHFSGNPTPEECITYWQSVVDGLSMLAHKNVHIQPVRVS